MNGYDVCSDEAAFRRAVLADPADDAPRLIYADWLDEQGDSARAELIRLQIAIRRSPPRDRARLALVSQQNSLLARHRAEWVGRLPEGLRVDRFSRGFAMIEIAEKASVFVERAPLWDAETPPEHFFRLRLKQAQDDLDRVLAAPLWRRTIKVDFLSSSLGDEGAAKLAASSALHSVIDLDLGWNQLTSAGVKAISNAPGLKNVRTLNLLQNVLGDDGATAIARSPYLTRLTSLQLKMCAVREAGIKALAESPLMDRLEQLSFGADAIGDNGLNELLRDGRGARLRELGLSICGIGDRGASTLASRPQLTGLRTLHLSGNRIGDDGAFALADSPFLSNVQHLDLTHNRIGALAAARLAERFGSRVRVQLQDDPAE